MEIVIDSHTLFWFFAENPKLSHKAKKLIKEAKKVIVPSIVLMEILYLFQRIKLLKRFMQKLFGDVGSSSTIRLNNANVSLTTEWRGHNQNEIPNSKLQATNYK